MNLFCDFKAYLVSYECDDLYPSAMDAKCLYRTKVRSAGSIALVLLHLGDVRRRGPRGSAPVFFIRNVAQTGATYHELLGARSNTGMSRRRKNAPRLIAEALPPSSAALHPVLNRPRAIARDNAPYVRSAVCGIG